MSGQNQSETTEQYFKELSDKIDDLRKELPNGELISLLNDVKVVMANQKELYDINERAMKAIGDINKTISDPESGLIVRINKNTEYRQSLEGNEADNAEILEEHQSLVKWKSAIDKFVWMVIAALIAIVLKLFFAI